MGIADHIEQELLSISPHLRIQISKRARRMRLKLNHGEREVRLVLPERANYRKALKFVNDHRQWIEEKMAELPDNIEYADNLIIPVEGKDHVIRIDYRPDYRSTQIAMQDGQLIVKTNKDDPATRIERFLKNYARDRLTELAIEKSERIGKTIQTVQVRDPKTRWGSCTSDRKLSFSWRLILAPYDAMDYVVAHEVAHLIHMNHSPKFWALCAELSGNFASGKDWMRTHGNTLLLYG